MPRITGRRVVNDIFANGRQFYRPQTHRMSDLLKVAFEDAPEDGDEGDDDEGDDDEE